MKIEHWRALHYANPNNLRLGQRFVNDFISGQWPELFYEENDSMAWLLIQGYLEQHQYGDECPPKANQ